MHGPCHLGFSRPAGLKVFVSQNLQSGGYNLRPRKTLEAFLARRHPSIGVVRVVLVAMTARGLKTQWLGCRWRTRCFLSLAVAVRLSGGEGAAGNVSNTSSNGPSLRR